MGKSQGISRNRLKPKSTLHTIKKKEKFKKCMIQRDNRQPHIMMKHFKPSVSSKENSQINNSTKKKKKMEESNTIAYATQNVEVLSDDDDCVCIEPTLVKITLDDTILESTPIPVELPTDEMTIFERSIRLLDSMSTKYANEMDSDSNMGLTDSSCNQKSTKSEMSEHVENNKKEISIIELDDTEYGSAINSQMDDSVIFVKETIHIAAPSFIPLESDDVPNPISVPGLKVQQKNIATDLFTRREKKEFNTYNNNSYNPTLPKQSKKRAVVIDGSNVAFGHGLNREFSVKGLTICIDFFSMKGHDVKAVVPQFRLQRNKSSNPTELETLHKAGKVVFTPCKALPGKTCTSYDDRFILQLACVLDAVVVSNDNYRDLIQENDAFKKIIENRVVGYSWCNDIFMLPKDPYGRFGPSLHSILNSI